MSRSTFRHAWSIALTAAALVVLLAPATVLAHAELDTSAPADGETVTGSPPTIEATYTETLDPDGSSLVLVDATGADIATGGVATTEPTKEMSITELPELAPGEYTVKSTTKSADDGDVDRTTWSFTVVAAPTPTPKPAPTPAGAPSPSTAPTPSPSAIAPSPSLATPTPSADTGDAAGNSSDALLPIIAGLAIVVVAAVLLLRRRGRTSPPA
jgi:methionine-rich copper-binding protein CopC